MSRDNHKEPTNADRAKAAEDVLKNAPDTGWFDYENDAETAIQDLLTDLMHLCDKLDKERGGCFSSFADILDAADRHYTRERLEEAGE